MSIPMQPEPVVFVDDRGMAGPFRLPGQFDLAVLLEIRHFNRMLKIFLEMVIEELVWMDFVRVVRALWTVVAVLPWPVGKIHGSDCWNDYVPEVGPMSLV